MADAFIHITTLLSENSGSSINLQVYDQRSYSVNNNRGMFIEVERPYLE